MNNIRPIETGLLAWAVGNPVATNLLTIVLIIGGILSFMSMKSEVFPAIIPNTVSVSVAFPGATPFEVEEGITRRVEEAVSGIDGVEQVRSVATTNSGSITIELADFADREKVKDAVESAVNQIANFPPERAEKPLVTAPEPVGGVITLVVTGDGNEQELRAAATEVEMNLATAPGVSLVSLVGARNYEIGIEISEDSLRKYGLSFDDVSKAIRTASLDISGGQIKSDEGSIMLRVNNKRQTGKDFENIVVRANTDGNLLYLGDVAEVLDGFADSQVSNTYNNTPAIFLQVSKANGEDVLGVKQSVDTFLADYTPPQGFQVIEFRDQSLTLKERFNLLSRNAIFGFGLVFLFLVIMFDLKLAFWICIGMATAFTGGFMLLGMTGISLTMITLFGMIIVIGLVVDDAVVIGESIDAHRKLGLTDEEAAIAGVKAIRAPVIVGVVTTIAAFSPLLFVGGAFSEITRAIPLVIICVLIVSLFEAFFLLPSHLASKGTWSRGILAVAQKKIDGAIDRFVNGPLRAAVSFCIRMRYATLVAITLFFIFSINMVTNGAVKVVFFPSIEGNEISVDVKMPEGTTFDKTTGAITQVETALFQIAKKIELDTGEVILKSIATSIGGRTGSSGGPLPSPKFFTSENVGQIRVELNPYGERSISAQDIERLWREETGIVDGIEILNFRSIIADFGAQVQFELSDFKEADLFASVEALKQWLSTQPGLYEISDSHNVGKEQFLFELNNVGRSAGLTSRDIALQIRQGFFGEEVQRIQRGREEVKVYVRFPLSERSRIQSLETFRIRLSDGTSFPLETVANITRSRAPAAINRVDGRRVITVNARVDDMVVAPGVINQRMITEVFPKLKKEFTGLKWTQSGAAQQQGEDFASIARAFLLVLLVIYTIIATQLRSYLQPLAVLVAVPLAIAGALLGHYALGFSLSFVSIFGIVALVGVAINASVVLVDKYNKFRDEGLNVEESAIRSSMQRFRPVILTTLTTALGLLPLLFETSPQAQFLIPMAVSLGFGILISGLLVIFSTPVICVLIESVRASKGTSVSSPSAKGEKLINLNEAQ